MRTTLGMALAFLTATCGLASAAPLTPQPNTQPPIVLGRQRLWPGLFSDDGWRMRPEPESDRRAAPSICRSLPPPCPARLS